MKKGVTVLLVITIIIISWSAFKALKSPNPNKYTEEVFATREPTNLAEIEYVKLIDLDLPTEATGRFKTYMDYRTITDKNSKQWELQQQAWTEGRGFRKIGEHFLVTVGTFYAKEVGKELLITLEDGTELKAIVGDIKQDRHTDPTNRYVPINGNIVEFIVDTKKLDPEVIRRGDVSWHGLAGKIKSIQEVERYARKIAIR